MKHLITLFVMSLFSSAVMAHLGHGDHSAIYASGQSHPVIGIEHLMLATLVAAIAFTLWRLFKR